MTSAAIARVHTAQRAPPPGLLGLTPRVPCVRDSFYEQGCTLTPDTSLSVLNRASGAAVCLLLSLSTPVVSLRQLAELPAHVYLRLSAEHLVPELDELIRDANAVLSAITATASTRPSPRRHAVPPGGVTEAAEAATAARKDDATSRRPRRSLLDEIPLADAELIEEVVPAPVRRPKPFLVHRHVDVTIGADVLDAAPDMSLEACPESPHSCLTLESPQMSSGDGACCLDDSWELLSEDAAATTPSETAPRQVTAPRVRSLSNSAVGPCLDVSVATVPPTRRSAPASSAASPTRSPEASRDTSSQRYPQQYVASSTSSGGAAVESIRNLPLSMLDSFQPEMMFALLSLRPPVKTLGDLVDVSMYKLETLCRDYSLSSEQMDALRCSAIQRISAPSATSSGSSR